MLLPSIKQASQSGRQAPPIDGVWRASAMAIPRVSASTTGYPELDRQIGGGWPRATITELLVESSGLGEICLLAPALAKITNNKQRLALISPPFIPCAAAALAFGISATQLLWLKPHSQADALWASEQILKHHQGAFGATVLWANEIRMDSLRRLALAAKDAGSHLFLVRPLARSQDASPAQLRIGLTPAAAGVELQFLKRQGPPAAERLMLRLLDLPAPRHPIDTQNETPDKPIPATAASRSAPALLV